MNATERAALLDFISTHACDDILIQVGTRIMHNSQYHDDIKVFMKKMPKTSSSVPDLGSRTKQETREVVTHADEVETVEVKHIDLGPACKKLGSNGQAIFALLKKDGTVKLGNIQGKLKLSEAKVKPMLALMLEREMIEWNGSDAWRVK